MHFLYILLNSRICVIAFSNIGSVNSVHFGKCLGLIAMDQVHADNSPEIDDNGFVGMEQAFGTEIYHSVILYMPTFY